MCCGTEAGSYLRLIDSCITQLKAQGPSRTCNESKEEAHAQPSHPAVVNLGILTISVPVFGGEVHLASASGPALKSTRPLLAVAPRYPSACKDAATGKARSGAFSAVLNWYSSHFKNNHFTEMCCGTEAGSYLRLIDSCITQLKAQRPCTTCNESKEEEEAFSVGNWRRAARGRRGRTCGRGWK